MPEPEANIPIGRRIHVWGNSCAGKSTLGARLADALKVPFVELDALNWLPDWVGLNETDPEELERRLREATEVDAWVVAGSYTQFAQPAFWSKLDTLVWIDLPLQVLVGRMFKRSWRRWRTREHLWGTNYENFWDQLKMWRKSDSMLWWIVTQQKPKRREMLAYQADPKWSHICFVRLRSRREVEEFARRCGAE